MSSSVIVGTVTNPTNWGALTSIVTPPASCHDTTVLLGANFNLYAQTDCWPSTDEATIQGPYWHYHSPGICFDGYTSQASQQGVLNFASDTTASFCCPLSYTLNSAQRCVTFLAGGQTVATASVVGATRVVTNTILTEDNTIYAPAMLVAYQATDSAIVKLHATSTTSSTRSSSTKSSSTSVSVSSTTTSSPTTSPNPNNEKSGGISSGAKIGIAIGIVGLVIALTLGIFFFFRRRGKQRKQKQHDGFSDGDGLAAPFNTHEMDTKHNVPELDVKDKDNGALVTKFEKDGRQVVVDPYLHEMDGGGEIPRSGGATSASPMLVPNHAKDSDAVSAVSRLEVDDEHEEARLKLLKDRMERIREEKARLNRIQELEELEAQTKRDIGGGKAGGEQAEDASRKGRIRELGDEEEHVQRDILSSQSRLYGN